MHKWKRLSGDQVVRILKKHGFQIIAKRGSHIKMRRITDEGEKQTLVIPNHKELDIGTSRAIMRQASRYIAGAELEGYFKKTGKQS